MVFGEASNTRAGGGAHQLSFSLAGSGESNQLDFGAREVSLQSRSASKGKITPGPSLFNKTPSGGASGGGQSSHLQRSNSVRRVTSNVNEKTGGLARALVQQKPTYGRPISPEVQVEKQITLDGMHVGVCPKCRVTIDSTREKDEQVLCLPPTPDSIHSALYDDEAREEMARGGRGTPRAVPDASPLPRPGS